MAATNFTPLSLYYSATASSTPLAANLVNGELALNTADGKLFYKDSSGNVQVLASKAGNVNVSSFSAGTTGLTPSTATTGAVTLAGTLAQANGGTGFGTYTTGDTLYASASNTLSKLAVGTNGQILRVVSGVPAWGTDYVGTVTSVSGTGTVNGLTLTGTVTSSGSLTLGGTLDLSSPPAIGATSASTGKFTSLTDTGLTSGRVTYATTGGLLTDSANMTFNGTTFTTANDASISGLTVGKGGGAVGSNTVVGNGALANGSNSGGLLSAFGQFALGVNTTGVHNDGYGAYSLYSNTTGNYNDAYGVASLQSNTTGSSNVAIGKSALQSNTTASYNTAVGYQALYTNSTGANNTAVGWGSLYSNTTGTANTAMGGGVSGSVNSTLVLNTTGSYNSAFGLGALGSNTTASYNTAVGYQAGYTNTTGAGNTFIGYGAGYTSTGSGGNAYNTCIGFAAGYALTTGTLNTFIGTPSVSNGAGGLITTGSKNTIIGGYNGNYGGLDIRTASNYIVLSDGDGNPRQVIDSSGNVGIGTATPTSAKLHVYSSSASVNIKSETGSGSQAAVIAKNSRDYIQIAVDSTTVYVDGGTSSPMAFYAGNAERMRIDSSGNVGIGTSSPAAKLNVIGNEIRFSNSTNASYYGSISHDAATTANNIYNCVDTGGHVFQNNGTERMRITSSGTLLVGTTSEISSGNGFAQFASVNGGKAGLVIGQSAGSSASSQVIFVNSNGIIGSISTSGSATSYNTSSDYRLKDNVAPMQNALATVAQLKPVTYKWKSDGSDGQGFIAHELAEVMPDCVTGEKDAVDSEGNPKYQGIDTSFLVATLTAAIQELKAEVDSLKQQLAK